MSYTQATRALTVLALMGGVATLTASVVHGPPSRLPGVALGWPLILYLERAAFVTLLVLGIGGTTHRLLSGSSQVAALGGGPIPTVTVEDATEPADALSESVRRDIRDISGRLRQVAADVEALKRDLPPEGQG